MSEPQDRALLHSRSLSALVAGRGDQAVTVAQLVTLLERVKEDVMADAQEKTDRLHRQLSGEVAAVSELSSRILAAVCTSTLETRSTRSRGSSSRKKGTAKPLTIAKLDLFESPDVAASEYLQFLMLVTVMAFIARFPNASQWVGTQTNQRMNKYFPILRQVSGFSFIFFSVRTTDAKAQRSRTPMGQARFLLVKWTLQRKVAITRAAIANAQESVGIEEVIPDWLKDFGNVRSTKKKISEILDMLNITEDNKCPDNAPYSSLRATSSTVSEVPGVPISPQERRPTKRRRCAEEIEEDPVLKAQIYGVRSARKKLLRALTHGRTGARKKIFSSLLFVLERIATYSDPAEASEDGFGVLFAPGYADDDSVPLLGPGMPASSPWKIDLALKRGQGTETAVRETNMQRFVQLQRAFPGLKVKLMYKVAVRRCPGDESQGLPEFNDPHLSVQASEEVSLHSVAASCLLGASRAADFHDVLQTSELSLRAIHVIAIGLRGLLKKALGLAGGASQLSTAEEAALGDVSARPVDKGDFAVTAMYGGGTKDLGEGAESISDLEKLRRSKLEMSWADYRARKAAEAESSNPVHLSDASQSESGDSAEENDWAHNAGI